MTVEIVTPETTPDNSLANKIPLLSPPQSTTESIKEKSNDSSITSTDESQTEENKKLDVSPFNEKNLTVNCNQAGSSSSSNSARNDSISPISTKSETEQRGLKRTRDSSTDNDSITNEKKQKSSDFEEESSPESSNSLKSQKNSSSAYSIMNILGNKESHQMEKKVNSAPNNSQMTPDIVALIQQQLVGAASASTGNNSGGMNQFLMNPFLAALSANQQQMPWFNMAAMSSLCGLEKGLPSSNVNSNNGLPSADQRNIQNMQRQNQQRKMNFSQSPTTLRTSSPQGLDNNNDTLNERNHANSTSNAQLQLQIGQLVNNLIQQQQHATIENDLSKAKESGNYHDNKPQQGFNASNLLIKSEHTKQNSGNLSRDSSHSSSPLSMTPPLNQRYLIENDMRTLDEQRHHKNINSGRLSFMDSNRNNKNAKNVYSNEDGGSKVYTNNGGASLDDDSENDENLEDDEDEDIDENDGDSFDNGHRKKKTRTVFSRNQVFQLESTFDMKRYLSSSERSSLANSLQLTETQIKIWFQNRRNKWKRQLAAEIEANSNQIIQNQSQHHIDSSNRGGAGGFPRANISGNIGLGSQPRMNHRLNPGMFSNTGQSESPIQSKQGSHFLNEIEQSQNHMASSGSSSSLSSSSTRSSLSSPSQNLQNSFNNATAMMNLVHSHNAGAHFNPSSSLLTPSMLAAAAAASSLYYAAQQGNAPQQQSNNQLAFSQFAALNNSQASSSAKQSVSGIL